MLRGLVYGKRCWVGAPVDVDQRAARLPGGHSTAGLKRAAGQPRSRPRPFSGALEILDRFQEVCYPADRLGHAPTTGRNRGNGHQGLMVGQVPATHALLGQRFLAGKGISLPQAPHLAQAKVPGRSLLAETTVKPSTSAVAAMRRSNGSLWCSGSVVSGSTWAT